jgi:hypothetical protein
VATRPMHPASTLNPKHTFDSALALLHQAESASSPGRSAIARRQPITAPASDSSTEKRALTDAARALAQLWNVSPHLVR